MKVTVTFDVGEESDMVIGSNSVERVINTTTRIVSETERDEDEVDTNIQDWEICKPIVVNIWNAVRDGIFRAKKDNMPQVRDWVV